MNDLDITVTSLSADEEMRVMQLFSQAPFSEEELQAQLAAHDAREAAVFAEVRRLTREIAAAAGAAKAVLERQRTECLESLSWCIDRRDRLEHQLRRLECQL